MRGVLKGMEEEAAGTMVQVTTWRTKKARGPVSLQGQGNSR